MNPVTKTAFKAVAVEECHEELEVSLFPVVRVAVISRKWRVRVESSWPSRTAWCISFGPEDRGDILWASSQPRHPTGNPALELPLHILVARELVERAMTRLVSRSNCRACGFEPVVSENLEGQMEAVVELVLPLLGEAARADDETALQVPAAISSLIRGPHDRFAGARSSASRKRSGWRGSMAS